MILLIFKPFALENKGIGSSFIGELHALIAFPVYPPHARYDREHFLGADGAQHLEPTFCDVSIIFFPRPGNFQPSFLEWRSGSMV